MIYLKKTINLTLIHIIIVLVFILLTILLFVQKNKKEILKLNNKIMKYKKSINRLKRNNMMLLQQLSSIRNQNYGDANIGSHNSSHSNSLSPSWLN
jgi:cell division protein FtsB